MVPSAGPASIGGYVSRRTLSTTSSVSMGKLQKFKDKFILTQDEKHKRPSDLEIANVDSVKHPRPAGYCAMTALYFGGLRIPTLLDYGATSSAIPEEVVCMLIE